MDDSTGWWLDEYDHDRFWDHVNRHGGTAHEDDPLATAEGECWTWTGWTDGTGYGRFKLFGNAMPAHRIAYVDGGRKNRIPEGYDIDHLCRNTICVRPTHLEPVTASVNMQRGSRYMLNRTHCDHGHKLSDSNILRLRRRDAVIMACKTCNDESRRRTYLKRKAAGKV